MDLLGPLIDLQFQGTTMRKGNDGCSASPPLCIATFGLAIAPLVAVGLTRVHVLSSGSRCGGAVELLGRRPQGPLVPSGFSHGPHLVRPGGRFRRRADREG